MGTSTILRLALAMVVLAMASGAEWRYDEQQDWPGKCASGATKGHHQSPIDIPKEWVDKKSKLRSLSFTPTAWKGATLTNTGHGVQVDCPYSGSLGDKCGTLSINGTTTLNIVQVHWHTLSENTVAGNYFEAEAHFVCMSQDVALNEDGSEVTSGTVGVVAVLFEEGEAMPLFTEHWSGFPAQKGSTSDQVDVSPATLLPTNMTYWGFKGSLTTPGCAEGLYWHVLTTPMTISKEQVASFKELLAGTDGMHGLSYSHRKTQPLNGRALLSEKPDVLSGAGRTGATTLTALAATLTVMLVSMSQ